MTSLSIKSNQIKSTYSSSKYNNCYLKLKRLNWLLFFGQDWAESGDLSSLLMWVRWKCSGWVEATLDVWALVNIKDWRQTKRKVSLDGIEHGELITAVNLGWSRKINMGITLVEKRKVKECWLGEKRTTFHYLLSISFSWPIHVYIWPERVFT